MIAPAPAFSQSLKTVLEDTVYSHPEYLALSANRRAIGEELRAAKGLGLPGVNLEKRYGLLNDDNTEQDYSEWSVKLRQPVLDGGKTISEVSRQNERVSSADQRVRDTANTLGLQTVQAYLEVMRSRRVFAIAQSNLSAIQEIVGRVRAKVRGGNATKADEETAKSRLYAARNIAAEAEIRSMDAEDLYLTMTGKKPGKLSKVQTPKAKMPKSQREAVAMAATASPKILAMQFDALAAEHAVGTAKSAIMPKLDVELSANYRDRINGTSAENTSYKAMMVFSMSLYNGGINTARIREAEHRAEEARNLADAARLTVEREIRLSWNTYVGTPKKVRALTAQASSNLRVRNLRKKQYETGKTSLISILDAQNEYVIAKVQAINDASMAKFAYFKILAATGELLDAYGLEETLIAASTHGGSTGSASSLGAVAKPSRVTRLISAKPKRSKRTPMYVHDR